MKENLEGAVDLILEQEGGYVNHPRDPGGETNFGITKATARAHGYSGSMRSLPKSFARQVYRDAYWDAVSGNELPPGVDLAVFDMAVNAGTSRAAKLLQQVLGVTDDGQIGPVTLAAAQRFGDFAKLVTVYADVRMSYYRSLRTWRTFGRGWAKRAKETNDAALKLVSSQREK